MFTHEPLSDSKAGKFLAFLRRIVEDTDGIVCSDPDLAFDYAYLVLDIEKALDDHNEKFANILLDQIVQLVSPLLVGEGYRLLYQLATMRAHDGPAIQAARRALADAGYEEDPREKRDYAFKAIGILRKVRSDVAFVRTAEAQIEQAFAREPEQPELSPIALALIEAAAAKKGRSKVARQVKELIAA